MALALQFVGASCALTSFPFKKNKKQKQTKKTQPTLPYFFPDWLSTKKALQSICLHHTFLGEIFKGINVSLNTTVCLADTVVLDVFTSFK